MTHARLRNTPEFSFFHTVHPPSSTTHSSLSLFTYHSHLAHPTLRPRTVAALCSLCNLLALTCLAPEVRLRKCCFGVVVRRATREPAPIEFIAPTTKNQKSPSSRYIQSRDFTISNSLSSLLYFTCRSILFGLPLSVRRFDSRFWVHTTKKISESFFIYFFGSSHLLNSAFSSRVNFPRWRLRRSLLVGFFPFLFFFF